MTPELLESVRSHSNFEERETCGVFVVTKPNYAEYFPCKNLSPFPDQCHFCPQDLAKAEDAGPLIGYVHTHREGSTPSSIDIEFCKRSNRPWWVVGPDSWQRINPGIPFNKRTFAWGIQDCFTLARDWYAAEGISIPDFLRTPDFWKYDQNPYMDCLSETGFEIVEGQPDYNDGIFMGIKTINNIPNHAAVHIGDGNILHHLPNRLSMVELYDGFYQDHTLAVVRRKK